MARVSVPHEPFSQNQDLTATLSMRRKYYEYLDSDPIYFAI